jgi:hypothetical protein
VLPVIVTLTSVSTPVPALVIPPPVDAVLSRTVLSTRISVPWLWIPPPWM